MSKVLPVAEVSGRDLENKAVVDKTKHLGVLDLLRGFASVVVLLFHFTCGALGIRCLSFFALWLSE
ncbi:MAG: hypothetical protein EOO61_12995 [Hymenobacter sp.]|nr:MAG: hypothetical protein EOO61_12995 [Hymenobacter sp.]